MEWNLQEGMKSKEEIIVNESHTAKAFGSGSVEVLATPMMISLMESAALKAVDPYLPEGFATVGTYLDVKHLGATPIGMKVYAEAQLMGINGKKLTFKIEAFDEKEKIGEGIHERYIITAKKFLEKANNKMHK